MPILLRATKALKTVGRQREEMLVLPGVLTTEMEMGVFVAFFTKEDPEHAVESRFWGLVVPHDLITCWRGMLILERMEHFDDQDLCNAYYGGMRKVHTPDEHRLRVVLDRIGRRAYEHIMRTPIPEEIIDLILKLKEEDKFLSLWSITEEVEAGTLEWRQEFADAGVTPPENPRKKGLWKRILKR
jgi:hypothetical protein